MTKGERNKFVILVDAFEVGVLTAMIWKHDDKKVLSNVLRQLTNLADDIRRKVGAKVEYLGNGTVKIVDNGGNVIIREIYPWERRPSLEG